MSVTPQRTIFGIHSLTPYNRITGIPYGTIKVIGAATIEMSGGLEYLFGGTPLFPWGAEPNNIEAKITGTLKEIPDHVMELLLGSDITVNVAEPSGFCSAIANVFGTSVFDATTGIATATIKTGSEADLKLNKYIVKAVSATTVDVYVKTDLNGEVLQDDLLKITVSPLTITTPGVATEIPNTGIELTGGTGAIAMTIGDTAEFDTRPINVGSSSIQVGESTTTFPAFGAVLTTKKSNGDKILFDCYNVVGSGFPIKLEEKVWSINDFEAALLYDAKKQRMFDMEVVRNV